MTHDELLLKVDEEGKDYYANFIVIAALRAVVELHKPVFAIVDGVKGPEYCQRCAEGRGYASYPCSTIKAIQEQLK